MKGFNFIKRITYKEPEQTGKNGGKIMRKCIKKMLMLMAAVVLLAGSASNVAYAHSGHHSQQRKVSVCYESCPQEHVCTPEGDCDICDVCGACVYGDHCGETTCYQNNTVCSGSHYTNHHISSRSGHHSERGHRFHH